jgi:hypothetical protein
MGVQVELARHRGLAEMALAARIQEGADRGEFSHGVDVRKTTCFYSAVYRGMAMQARDGASRSTLLGAASMAMLAWPEQ